MLDKTTNIKMGNNTQNITFNAPATGTLQKSHPKSVFIRFQMNSEMESMIFPANHSTPYLRNYCIDYSNPKREKYEDTNYRV